MSKKRVKTHSCPNCLFQFSADIDHTNFCPNCGQENHNPRYPVIHYVYELFESITHFDTKFWYSLKILFRNPGQITKNYIENIRGRYTSPVRMLVLTIAISIIIIVLHDKSFIANRDSTTTALTMSEEFDRASDTFSMNLIDPPFNLLVKDRPILYTELRKLKQIQNDSIGNWLESINLRNDFVTRLFAKSKKTYISRNITQEQLANTSGKLFNILLFFLIPIFSIVYYILFYKKFLLFYDTMIFSMHSMIVLLIMVMFLQLAEMTWRILVNSQIYLGQSKAMIIEFILPLFINFIPASKKVFGFGWISTIFRMCIGWIVSIFLMMIILTVVFTFWI